MARKQTDSGAASATPPRRAGNWPTPEQIIARLGAPRASSGRDSRFELIARSDLVLDQAMKALIQEAFTLHEGFPMDSFTPLVTDLGRNIGKASLVRVCSDDKIRFGRPKGSVDSPDLYVPIAINRKAEETSVLSMLVHTHYAPGSGSEMPLWGVIVAVVRGEMPRQLPSGFNFVADPRYMRSLRRFWKCWAFAGDITECEGPLLDTCPWRNGRRCVT